MAARTKLKGHQQFKLCKLQKCRRIYLKSRNLASSFKTTSLISVFLRMCLSLHRSVRNRRLVVDGRLWRFFPCQLHRLRLSRLLLVSLVSFALLSEDLVLKKSFGQCKNDDLTFSTMWKRSRLTKRMTIPSGSPIGWCTRPSACWNSLRTSFSSGSPCMPSWRWVSDALSAWYLSQLRSTYCEEPSSWHLDTSLKHNAFLRLQAWNSYWNKFRKSLIYLRNKKVSTQEI